MDGGEQLHHARQPGHARHRQQRGRLRAVAGRRLQPGQVPAHSHLRQPAAARQRGLRHQQPRVLELSVRERAVVKWKDAFTMSKMRITFIMFILSLKSSVSVDAFCYV